MSVSAGRLLLLQELIDGWDPGNRADHCSNCLHAVVGLRKQEVVVRCEMGHGRPTIDLFALLRRSHPSAFLSARKCPDFAPMDDEEET